MSDDGFDFNFNKDTPRVPGLDAVSAKYVEETVAASAGSRVRAITALAAARSLVLHDTAGALPPETRAALEAVCEELERVEYALRDLEDGAPLAALITPSPSRRRPAESNAVIEFQVRAVAAVMWLQKLASAPLSKADAISSVAKQVPRGLLNTRAGRDSDGRGTALTPDEQLVAWLDAAGRKGNRRNGRLQELWYELTVEHGVEPSRQTSAQVIDWLKQERQRLVGANDNT